MLAIVIPYYRVEFLDATLASLHAQTNKQFAVYIANDKSPHDCTHIVAKYQKDLQIHYKAFDNNLGQRSLAGHWQRCLNLLGNEQWVIFLGDDDLLSANCVEQFYDALNEVNQRQIHVMRYSSCIINECGENISHQYMFPEVEKSTSAFIRKIQRKSRASLSEHIFRREVIESNGFADMPVAWHSDDIAILETSGFGDIYTINHACASIRYSPLSVSGKSNNAWRKNLATLKFIKYLIGNKMQCFTKQERYFLIWFYFKKLKHFRKLSLGCIVQILGFFYKNFRNYTDYISKPVILRRTNTQP